MKSSAKRHLCISAYFRSFLLSSPCRCRSRGLKQTNDVAELTLSSSLATELWDKFCIRLFSSRLWPHSLLECLPEPNTTAATTREAFLGFWIWVMFPLILGVLCRFITWTNSVEEVEPGKQGRPFPLSQWCILHIPRYFQKLYKCSLLFPPNLYLSPSISQNLRFCLIQVFFICFPPILAMMDLDLYIMFYTY